MHCAKCRRAPRPYEDHVQQRFSYKPLCLHPLSRFCVQTTFPPRFLMETAPCRRFFYKPHPFLPLSQFCSSTTFPPRLLLESNFQPTFAPEGANEEGTMCRCKENSFWERYGATPKQIITAFQLYDLQLLVFLSFS